MVKSAGNFVYKYTNQSSKYTNVTFHLKSPNVPEVSITIERFTVYNLVVLYLCQIQILNALRIFFSSLSETFREKTTPCCIVKVMVPILDGNSELVEYV